MKRLTKLEIIDETVKYYQTHNRALIDDNCTYLNDKGESCAFGRCMLPEYRDKYRNDVKIKVYSNDPNLSLVVLEGGLDKVLMEEYRGHDIYFWLEIQWLHDNPSNWNGLLLTESGRANVNNLKHQCENDTANC